MNITPGTYRTRDGQKAVVHGIGVSGTHCFGSVNDQPECWLLSGRINHTHEEPRDLIERISDQTQTWRERVMELIETATVDPQRPDILVNGDVQFDAYGSFVDISKASTAYVALRSPEIIAAFQARMTELKNAADRAHDDANAEAIERILA